MANLKNALIACSVYIVSIIAFYGFRQTVSSSASAHWGAGAVGRDITDVMSDAPSAVGGLYRHSGFAPYSEHKGGGAEGGGYSDVTGTGK